MALAASGQPKRDKAVLALSFVAEGLPLRVWFLKRRVLLLWIFDLSALLLSRIKPIESAHGEPFGNRVVPDGEKGESWLDESLWERVSVCS